MQPSRADVTAVARRLRESMDLESYRNCNPINPEIRSVLKDEYSDLEVECLEGTIRYTPRSAAGSDHLIVRIPSGELPTVSEDLYIDGALDQFCKELKEKGRIGATLPSRNGDGPARRAEFDTVEVFTPSERPTWWKYIKIDG